MTNVWTPMNVRQKRTNVPILSNVRTLLAVTLVNANQACDWFQIGTLINPIFKIRLIIRLLYMSPIQGFIRNDNSCVDEDECSAKAVLCPRGSTCQNTAGSYKCTCNKGYSYKDDKCVDIDECTSKSHSCSSNEQCSNSPGSYNCACKSGL